MVRSVLVETFRAEHDIEDSVDPFKGIRSNDQERRQVEATLEEINDREPHRGLS